jgi:HAMP domain-containing protein
MDGSRDGSGARKKTRFWNRIVKTYAMILDISVAAAAVVVFAVILYGDYRSGQYNNLLLIRGALAQLDNFLTEMDDIARSAMSSEPLIRKFRALRDGGGPENYFENNVLEAIDMSSILRNIVGPRRRGIFRISAYNDRGDFISAGTVTDAASVRAQLSSPVPGEMMEEFKTCGRSRILALASRDKWSVYFKSGYISLVLPIRNLYSEDVVGLVEVQKSVESLVSAVGLLMGDGRLVDIYDGYGAPAFIQAPRSDYRVAETITSNAFGWKLELMEKKQALYARASLIFLGMAICCAVLIALAHYVIYNITRRVVLPLESLRKSVEEIHAGNPEHIDAANLDIEEVYEVAEAFNKLMDDVTFSLEQEKKSSLMAMQAQMNPHFLHNALSVASAYAIDGRNDAVVSVCGNISDMLRYTSSFDRDLVTVGEEIHYTKLYLELMRARYENMLTYGIRVEDSVRNETMPKLSIQPLCENCFNHAFSSVEPPYDIRVFVRAEADGWSVEVLDNGAGFGERERAAILKRAGEADYKDIKDFKIGGLGIMSSVVRMRLSGRKVRCEIDNLKPAGASVRLRVGEG